MRNRGQKYDTHKQHMEQNQADRLEAIETGAEVCPVCNFPFGTKKTFLHPDGAITHARTRCASNYNIMRVKVL